MATYVHQKIKLAFEERGVGRPAFVFVHGWSCDRSFFAPQVEHFSRQHRVVAVDLRGHGESDKPQGVYRISDYADDTASIVDQLGFGKVVAVGHSSGAWTVMQLAALHPELVGGNRNGRYSAVRDDTGTPRECRGDGGSNGTRNPEPVGATSWIACSCRHQTAGW